MVTAGITARPCPGSDAEVPGVFAEFSPCPTCGRTVRVEAGRVASHPLRKAE